MARSTAHKFVGWLCLFCIGLQSSVLTGGLVLCMHADGSSQIEWGTCVSGESGVCVAGCPSECSEVDEGSPQPCTDIPLKGDRHVAKLTPRPIDQLLPAAVVVSTLSTYRAPELTPRGRSLMTASEGRPPDALGRLRSVVLLV